MNLRLIQEYGKAWINSNMRCIEMITGTYEADTSGDKQ